MFTPEYTKNLKLAMSKAVIFAFMLWVHLSRTRNFHIRY